MKKNYTIHVEGNRNQRWIVREIIEKYVDGHVYADPEFHEIGIVESVDGRVKTLYHETVYYDFQTKKKVYKKIIGELKKIGLNVYPCMKDFCQVVY